MQLAFGQIKDDSLGVHTDNKAYLKVEQLHKSDSLCEIEKKQLKEAVKIEHGKFEAQKAYSDSTDSKYKKLTDEYYILDSKYTECKSSNKYYRKQNGKLIGWVVGEGITIIGLLYVIVK